MTAPIAITGTFADLKSVKTRSTVQMIIECPIEAAAEIVAIFGFPQPGKEVPVAVARLNMESLPPINLPDGNPYRKEVLPNSPPTPNDKSQPSSPPQAGEAPIPGTFAYADKKAKRRLWDELPPSQQAAIRCGEKSFQKFLDVANELKAADLIRLHCRVTSRADIKPGTEAARLWHELEKVFQAWLTIA